MSKFFRLDRKIGFQNSFYTKCIDVIFDSIGPSIILRSIVYQSLQSPSVVRLLTFSNISSKTTGPIKLKFHMETP